MANILKRVNFILNSVIGLFMGVFIGHSIYRYYDYTNHPDLYEIQSAPWYASIQTYGLAVALIVFIAIIIKLLIKKKMQNI